MPKDKVLSENSYNMTHVFSTFIIILIICLVIISCAVVMIYVKFEEKDTIQEGVYIKNVYVSGLNKNQAVERVKSALSTQMADTVELKYHDNSYFIEVEQINAIFDVESSVDYALNIAKTGKPIDDFKQFLNVYVNNINIEPVFYYDDAALTKYLEQIEADLPDQLIQPSYYVEDDQLIITNGVNGAGIEMDQIKEEILNSLQSISYADKSIEIPTYVKYPDPIDISAIHSDIYRQKKDAYYTTNPYAIYTEVVGVDFNIQKLQDEMNNNPNQEEYVIDLDYSKPDVTINDLGMDAFPNRLATFSTEYVNNPDRTTNLRLASNKINGTVIMPGEEFSYNKVVGKRTIAAGYKEAAIFSDGQVTNGVGGGICQVTTTLYNAAVKADLDITSRRNHMFIPSYIGGGKDATVAWGSTDFKFVNSRDYPIKIKSSVSDGVCTVSIYGLKTDHEYDSIYISTKTIKNTSNSIVIDSYKVYERDGEVVKSEKIDRDTYKKQ